MAEEKLDEHRVEMDETDWEAIILGLLEHFEALQEGGAVSDSDGYWANEEERKKCLMRTQRLLQTTLQWGIKPKLSERIEQKLADFSESE